MEARLAAERAEAWRQERERKLREAEALFRSGAECKWTPIGENKQLFCRVNGEAFRLTPTPEKKWALHRVTGVEEDGRFVGVYARRGDVNKALSDLAGRR